jgi:hypothetical protein
VLVSRWVQKDETSIITGRRGYRQLHAA